MSTVTGDVADRDFTFYIESIIDNNVSEDKDLYVDVKVVNDSSHTIHVKLNQKGNRLRLMDRSGNIISIKSDREKVIRV